MTDKHDDGCAPSAKVTLPDDRQTAHLTDLAEALSKAVYGQAHSVTHLMALYVEPQAHLLQAREALLKAAWELAAAGSAMRAIREDRAAERKRAEARAAGGCEHKLIMFTPPSGLLTVQCERCGKKVESDQAGLFIAGKDGAAILRQQMRETFGIEQ